MIDKPAPYTGVLVPEYKYRELNKSLEYGFLCEDKLREMAKGCQPIVRDPVMQIVLPAFIGLLIGFTSSMIIFGK